MHKKTGWAKPVLLLCVTKTSKLFLIKSKTALSQGAVELRAAGERAAPGSPEVLKGQLAALHHDCLSKGCLHRPTSCFCAQHVGHLHATRLVATRDIIF